MIVCSCNVLSENQIRRACQAAGPRSTGQVYGCLGCSAQCGRCARTIRKIMDEAVAAASCATACGHCPVARNAADKPAEAPSALSDAA